MVDKPRLFSVLGYYENIIVHVLHIFWFTCVGIQVGYIPNMKWLSPRHYNFQF